MFKFGIDPKALGAFVEYTLKPIIEDANELLDRCDGRLRLNALLEKTYRIFLFQQLTSTITSIIVTGMICFTAYLILSRYPLTNS